MDKKVFFAALAILPALVIWLLADMGFIHIDGISKEEKTVLRKQIGTVEDRRQTLKRRHLDSIVWQETQVADPLYYLDSVLTLDQSSATLKLEGDTQITLSENTLVVLEPSQSEKSDQIRVRFSRGDLRSRNPNRSVALEATTWTVEVDKGSEVSLRTKDAQNLEMEVHSGKVKIKEASQEKAQEFETGDVLKMTGEQVEQFKIDEDLAWIKPLPNVEMIRKYSHNFPTEVRLQWKGPAQELTWEDPQGKTTNISLSDNSEDETRTHTLALDQGLHHFRLKNGTKTSSVLPVEVWKAPEIQTFWPLPRDRQRTSNPISFSWSTVEGVNHFQINLYDQQIPVFTKDVRGRSSSSESINLEGPYEWSVQAFDSLGFTIPEYYRSPIFLIQKPLEAPQLETPEFIQDAPPIRKPAEKPPGSAWLNLLKLFISTAHADGHKALFKWKAVEGADTYLIEIDDESNFKTPLVQMQVKQPNFVWENFKLGNYFWRVAAEGKNREMGLFSPVTPVDLTNPKVFTPPPEVLSEIKAPVAAPVPVVASPKVEKPKPKPREVIYSPPPKPDPVVAEAPIYARPIVARFYFEPVYEWAQGNGDQNIKTQFGGPHLLSLSSRWDFPIQNPDVDLALELSYREGEFKALPESDYPFQKKLKRKELRGGLLYGKKQQLKYGLRSSTYQILKRKSFEEIEAQENFSVGPALLYPLTENFEVSGALLVGQQSFLLEAEARYLHSWLLGESLSFQLGAELGLRTLNNSSYRESQVLPKAIFGFSW